MSSHLVHFISGTAPRRFIYEGQIPRRFIFAPPRTAIPALKTRPFALTAQPIRNSFPKEIIPEEINGHKTAILPPSLISRPKDALTAPAYIYACTKCGGAQYRINHNYSWKFQKAIFSIQSLPTADGLHQAIRPSIFFVL